MGKCFGTIIDSNFIFYLDTDTIITDSSQSIKLRLENERLTYEINRLKKLLQNSEDGAIGGVYLSDSNSADGHSSIDDKSRIERLESELKKAKDQITSKNSLMIVNVQTYTRRKGNRDLFLFNSNFTHFQSTS